MAETNSGVLLDHMVRTSGCGTWWSAATSGGYPLGLLQIEPTLIASPAAQTRAAAAVAAVRGVSATGVLRTTELMVEAKRAWLVVAMPPAPTVADLIASGTALSDGNAAGVAIDVAQALRELHSVGLGHGDLATDTVVLTAAGGAALVEVGVLAALRDARTDVGRDCAAWAQLARDLARLAPSAEAEALVAAAATAQQGDLAAAISQLTGAAADLPDFADRAGLVASLSAVRPGVAGAPVPRSSVDGCDDGVRLRFGSGVPAIAAAEPGAPTTRGRSLAPAGTGAPAPVPGAVAVVRRGPVRIVVGATLLLLLLLVAGAALWWQGVLP